MCTEIFCLCCMSVVGSQLEGLTLNAQLREAGKQAEVLGKQAASNIKKGFGAIMQGAKELSAKAHAEISRRNNRLGYSSDGAGQAYDAGEGAIGSTQALVVCGRPAQVPETGTEGARCGDGGELL